MDLSSQSRELFRIALLRVLEANTTRFGLSAQTLAFHVQPFGFTPSPQDVSKELQYLEDKNFVAQTYKALSPENRTWRITAEGRDITAEGRDDGAVWITNE